MTRLFTENAQRAGSVTITHEAFGAHRTRRVTSVNAECACGIPDHSIYAKFDRDVRSETNETFISSVTP